MVDATTDAITSPNHPNLGFFARILADPAHQGLTYISLIPPNSAPQLPPAWHVAPLPRAPLPALPAHAPPGNMSGRKGGESSSMFE